MCGDLYSILYAHQVYNRDSSVQQINLSSSNSISSSSSKDIANNAILTNSNNNNNKKKKEQSSSPTRRTNNNINNNNNNKRPNKIILLGERHSGTNWITNYLKDCFVTNNSNIRVQESYTRFKHWFQQDDISIVEEDSAVVSMFRDPMVR